MKRWTSQSPLENLCTRSDGWGRSVLIPDSAVYPPPPPRYEAWRSLLTNIKLRFSVRAEVERGADYK